MAQRKRKPAEGEATSSDSVSAQDKIARLLGLLVVKDITQKTDQVTLLRSAGFQVSEVAAMLGITENHVMVAAHMGRKKTGKKKAKSKTR